MNPRVARIVYGPPDYFVRKTSARDRRAIGFWLLVFWLGPGTVVFAVYPNAVWYVSFMSLFALWWTGFGAFSAETPVEMERP